MIKKIMLLGSGELGKEFVIAVKRLGCHVIAVDAYAGAPAMQVADECEVMTSMLHGDELDAIVAKHKPDIIVPEIEAIRTERFYDYERQGIQVVPSAKAANVTMNRRAIRDLAAQELGLHTAKYLYAASEEELRDAVGKIWNGVRPQFASVIWDGDGVRKNGMPFGPECKGHWVLTASTKQKPQVVGMDNINVELAPQDIYSGMYARVTIRFFGYKNSSCGVGCGLGNIMKTRDGEPLAGGASAASDFAGVGNAVVPPVDAVTGRAINPLTGLPM